MEYTVKALANLAGITPRTLRWYDSMDLLKPLRTTEAGYRIYGPQQVDRLQTILFYRELGMELSAIRGILNDPDFDRQKALQSHLSELEAQRARLDGLILTVKHSIADTKGSNKMSDREKFEAFKRQVIDANERTYGKEIRAQYGDETVDQSNDRFLSLTQEEYERQKALEEEILQALTAAVRQKLAPSDAEGQRIAALHRQWLSYSWKHYTPQAHAGVAQMYAADRRFTAYYDREEPGCAVFLRDAILLYTSK